MVREHAAEAGYSFVGPVQVSFEKHANVGTGVFRIRSNAHRRTRHVRHRRRLLRPPALGPRPAPAGALPRRPRLIVSVGDEESAYFLTHPVTVIGRAAESDLRLDDSGVSRRHAELRYIDGKSSWSISARRTA